MTTIMKRKIIILGILLSTAQFLFFAMPETESSLNENPLLIEERETSKEDEEEFDLHGELGQSTVRSLTPFLGFVGDDYVRLVSLRNLTDIRISVDNLAGVNYYFDETDPKSGEELIIDASDWPAGVYTITITDNYGGILYGVFSF